ncbi:MAG TPA: hypothetical protein VFQ92_22275 [Blastocatellia bacterium]|nr:hypothetical protein [Blastocatellia bacterium]
MSLLGQILGSLESPVERRLFAEYGAVFLTKATPPPVVIFNDREEVERFQATLDVERALIGEHEIELQREAMKSLLAGRSEMESRGGAITARAADAGRRSYDDTVALWTRNVTRGLEHWQQEGMLTPERAEQIIGISPIDQVGVILDMEESEHLYFGTYFDRSILYSVAAPGASQHLSLLAFDVAEFEDETVEQVLGNFGWFRTVVSDFPHFTYLGYRPEELAGIGLKPVTRSYKDRDYIFRVPDL